MSQDFLVQRRVVFSETDMAGVMHFSNYFRWMEDAECAFWRSIGLSEFVAHGDGVLCWPRIAVECRYRAPLRFEQEAEIRLRITGMTTKSLKLRAQIFGAGQLAAEGSLSVVCCLQKSGEFQSIAIPDSIRMKLEPLIRAAD